MALLALIVALSAADAYAYDVPGINGHMTDPTQALSDVDKTTIEDKLSKIQQDTRIDVAGWIVDAPAEALQGMGDEAYRRWRIGMDWDNGIFFIVPKSGRARLIQNRDKPEVSGSDAAQLVAADDPQAPMVQRINRMADAAGTMLRATALRPRPQGLNHPRSGLAYSAGAAFVFLAAVGLSLRERRLRNRRTGSNVNESEECPNASP
jgi:hypothetical protein